jgi:deoxycytidylate deaminase
VSRKIFDVARAVSRTSRYPRIKIGCCIVKKNRVLSVGVNLLKSHPLQKKYNHYRPIDENHIRNNIHAELDAIRKCSKQDLTGASIYIYREDSIGRLRICRPCEACMRLIRESGISVVYYTTEDGFCKEVLV